MPGQAHSLKVSAGSDRCYIGTEARNIRWQPACTPLPVDAVKDLPYNASVDRHVDGKQARALVD